MRGRMTMRARHRKGLATVMAVVAAFARARSESAFAPQPLTISGVVHEAKPTTDAMIAGARIEVIRGELAGSAFMTSADGAFVLPPVITPGFALKFEKAGYETAVVDIKELSGDGRLDVAMRPDLCGPWSLEATHPS